MGKHGIVEVEEAWFTRNPKLAAGGYYVEYEDGYTSYCPAAAFETGYTLEGSVETEHWVDVESLAMSLHTATRTSPQPIIVNKALNPADIESMREAMTWGASALVVGGPDIQIIEIPDWSETHEAVKEAYRRQAAWLLSRYRVTKCSIEAAGGIPA